MIGLRYFSLDTRFDEKVEALEAEHGNDGFAVWIKALQEVYRTTDGKLAVPNDLMCRVYARRSNVTPKVWRAIIATCVEIGLFNADEYTAGWITSSGIQKRLDEVRLNRKKDRDRHGSDNLPPDVPPPDFPDDFPMENSANDDGFPGGKLPDKCTNGKVKENGKGNLTQNESSSAGVNAHARESTVTKSIEFAKADPPVLTAFDDGMVIVDTHALTTRLLAAYHLPDKMREPLRAWLETHDDKAKRHDVEALLKRVDECGPDEVTIGIRNLGNRGWHSIKLLDRVMTELRVERVKREREQARAGV